MLSILNASEAERRRVIESAAKKMSLAPAIVEKDLWVCYALDVLFHRFEYADRIIFKGGTSLMCHAERRPPKVAGVEASPFAGKAA